ncbi:acyltransferase [Agromyces sp. MMS24-JH15]|uniref:acyltransferase family protein n=1 Tax=Agromyces sp. MMS24-JH15 TaxID=3243765 RepID=UPI003749471D
MTQSRTAVERAALIARRDVVVDLARAACILLVVVAHLLMIGVWFDDSGAIVLSRPAEAQPWFAAATWAGQVMPLFFALGGFTAITAWRSLQKRGGDSADFVRARVLRLATPALPLFIGFALGLGTARLAGADPELLDAIAKGAGSPLWFLGAFLLVQCLVPITARLHRRAPVLTLAGLAGTAALIDAARIASGVETLGHVNIIFIWAFVQQLGFWMADGWFKRRTAPQLTGLAAVSYLTIWLLVERGWYSPDMLTNLNPPTGPLGLLGIAQVSILTLLYAPLNALMRLRAVRATVSLVGSRSMTIYLWHLPIIIGVAALMLLAPWAMPEPATAAWWWSRALILVVVLGLVWLVSIPLARFEALPTAIPEGYRRPAPGATYTAAALAFIPPFLVIEFFLDLRIAVVGVVLLGTAFLLVRPRRVRASAA